MRSPEAARAGGTGNGLSISLLERFIHRNQAEAAELIAQGLAPATGDMQLSVLGCQSCLQPLHSAPSACVHPDETVSPHYTCACIGLLMRPKQESALQCKRRRHAHSISEQASATWLKAVLTVNDCSRS